MSPEVQLAYDSGSGNGPLGLGWRLDVPALQRQTDKGLPQYTAADTFITFTGEELVALADGTFRAENEAAFTRWENLGADGWRATRADGTVLRYGRTGQARLEHPTLGIFKWLLESAQDLHGNRVEYAYVKDAGDIYLRAIEFGRHVTLPSSFYRLTFQYETNRPDYLTDYRGRFRRETRWRLANATLDLQGRRIRFWKFGYQPGAPLSLLTSFTQFGDARSRTGPDASFNTDFLPPETMDYWLPTLGQHREWTDVAPFLNLRFASGMADFVDINRDGLPDVLFDNGGKYFSSLNQGAGKPFGAPREFTSSVYYPALAAPNTKLADLRGDGSVKVLVDDGEHFYYRPFASPTTLGQDSDYLVPGTFPLGNPEVQVVDLDNDRALDFVAADEGDSTFAMVLSRAGKGSPTLVKSPPTPLALNVRFADGWQFADVNGDRMPDLVRIGTREEGGTVFYPGKGFGEFDSAEAIGDGPDGPAEADRTSGKMALVDLDGDGLADLVSVRSGVVKIWANRSGRAWAAPLAITDEQVPGWSETTTAVRFVDLNGNGSVDIVWNDPDQGIFLRYLDLNPGTKPNVLTRLANGIGRSITIQYRSSTDYMTEAAGTANEWTSVAPFPVPVVAQIVEGDGLGASYTNRFTYRNAYYDGEEREFRGFEQASKLELGNDSQDAPTLVTRFEFDTGATHEALKGKPLRIVAATVDGRVFFRETNTWLLRPLPLPVTAGEPRRVTYAFQTRKQTQEVELGSEAEAVTLEQEFEEDDFGNLTRHADYGIVADGNRSAFDDERVVITEFSVNTNAWILHSPRRTEVRDEQGNVLSRINYFYDDETFSGLNGGVVTTGNLTMKREWTNAAVAAGFITTARTRYDAYGNPRTLLDPLAEAPSGVVNLDRGHAREVDYDDILHTYPVTETIHLGEGKPPLVFRAAYDVGLGMLTNSTDFNGTVTAYSHDTFARLVSLFRPGDAPDYPSAEYSFHLAVPVGSGTINFVETRLLDQAPSSAVSRPDHYFITRQFVDGLGRARMTRTEAEPAPGSDAPRVVVSGVAQFNARRQPSRTINPFFSLRDGRLADLLDFEDIEAPGWQGQFHADGELLALNLAAAHATRTAYDATLRAIGVTNPDGTRSRTVYQPRRTLSYDENDNDPASPFFDTPMVHYQDGLGRLVRVDEITRLNDDGTPANTLRTWTTRYGHDLNDQLTRITDSQNNVKTFAYDGLQRKVFMDDPDRGVMRFTFDDGSNLIETTDAKGQRLTYTYDGANRILSEDYHDEGLPFSRNFDFNPALPVSATNRPDVAYFYDEPLANLDVGDGSVTTAANVKGRLAYVWDLSGEEHTGYDARSRVDFVVKRVRDPLHGQLVSYRTSFAYDTLDRLNGLTYPDNDEVGYRYNARNLLARITGGPAGSIIADASYLPSGQQAHLLYGNGVATRYAYDERLRLNNLHTAPQATPASPFIAFAYDFDAVSNIRRIEDRRPGSVVPAGDPRRNTQLFQYDDIYRLTRVQYSFALPGEALRSDGQITNRYDRIANMLAQTSDLPHVEKGLPVANLGEMDSGGSTGRWNRHGRGPDDEPGPHALTALRHPSLATRHYPYDSNGNMTNLDGMTATWDFKDRLVALEDATMHADYAYDYTDRRITKRVTPKTPDASPQTPSTVTYVGKHFEVREYEAPTKFVWSGDTRLARVTGTLSPNERVQRLRVNQGWNLVSVAVTAPNGGAQLAATRQTDGLYRWNPAALDFEALAPTDTVPAGSVLWIRAVADATLRVTGMYPGPMPNLRGPPEGAFVPGHGLEPLPLTNQPPSLTAWHFAPDIQAWQTQVGRADFRLSDVPPVLAVSGAIYALADQQVDLEVPDPALSLRFYHQDHLGSSGVLADAVGAVVEESSNYPFGSLRVDFRPKGIREEYQFVQGELDRESSLCQLGVRTYHPVLGRWLSTDPIGQQGGMNLYAYAKNNPAIFSDRGGQAVWLIPVAAYLVWTAIESGAETAVEAGIANVTGDQNFSAGRTFAVNYAVNATIGAVPGVSELKFAAKTADYASKAPLSSSALKNAVSIVGDSSSTALGKTGGNYLTKSAGQLGQEGEALASQITGVAKNTKSWVVHGRTRIPDQVLAQDILTRNPTLITEVKNVQYQSLTRQLRDYADLVGPGGRVDVALPPGAKVSKKLEQAFKDPESPLNRIDLVPPR